VPTGHPPVAGSWSAGQGPVARRLAVPLCEFLDTEVAGGLVLLAATALALGWANSPWSSAYEALWGTELAFEVGQWTLALDLRHWVKSAPVVRWVKQHVQEMISAAERLAHALHPWTSFVVVPPWPMPGCHSAGRRWRRRSAHRSLSGW
jgi:Na+/H+ antiporter NhaA